MANIICPDCGMEQEEGPRCQKCDYPLYADRLHDDLARVAKKKAPPEPKPEPQAEPEPKPEPKPKRASSPMDYLLGGR